MSRMTKFLKQFCQVEVYELNGDGNPECNRFGEIIYKSPVTCKCRREKTTKGVQVENGSWIQTTTRYFLDETLEPFVNYRIDGHVVLSVEEYTNEHGKTEGYEVYV